MYQENLVYGQVLGAGLLADIASPDGDVPFPVILSVHGGRWIAGDRRDKSAIDVRQWAGFGYFAMSIDYRLVTCSPAPACYQDLQCAIRWVHAHADDFHLDLDRFYLIGQSAGGHLVSLAATLGDGRFGRMGGWEDQSNDITAAISVVPIPRRELSLSPASRIIAWAWWKARWRRSAVARSPETSPADPG